MLEGICDICGKPGKLYTCQKCGKRVCENHYHSGLCTDCFKGKKLLSGESELVIPDSAKPTTVSPDDVRK